MVGSFTNLFHVAILVTGDSDFVSVVNEVRRRGVMVVVAGVQRKASGSGKRQGKRQGQIFTGCCPNHKFFVQSGELIVIMLTINLRIGEQER